MITDELENELRSAFARSAASIVIPEQARKRLLQRDYHPRRLNRGLAAGLAAAAVAAGIAVPLAGIGSQPAAGPVIRLASHTFRMPAGYQLTAATSAPCHAFAVVLLPASSLPPHAKGPVAQNPPYGAGMRAAASASGGCILLVLAPRYTPTAAIPDPEAPAAARPVQVGRYHGLIFHASMFVAEAGFSRRAAEHGIRPGWSRFTELFVPLPAGGGKMRDLVIGAKELSDATLIQIAANGLSSSRVAQG